MLTSIAENQYILSKNFAMTCHWCALRLRKGDNITFLLKLPTHIDSLLPPDYMTKTFYETQVRDLESKSSLKSLEYESKSNKKSLILQPKGDPSPSRILEPSLLMFGRRRRSGEQKL